MLNRVLAESFSDVRAERVGRVRPFTRLSSRVVRGLGRAFLYLSIGSRRAFLLCLSPYAKAVRRVRRVVRGLGRACLSIYVTSLPNLRSLPFGARACLITSIYLSA